MSHYIKRVLIAVNAVKIVIERCSFDYKLKDFVDLNLVRIVQETYRSLDSSNDQVVADFIHYSFGSYCCFIFCCKIEIR